MVAEGETRRLPERVDARELAHRMGEILAEDAVGANLNVTLLLGMAENFVSWLGLRPNKRKTVGGNIGVPPERSPTRSQSHGG